MYTEFIDTSNNMNYEWVDTIKRENTTELSFPELHAGDAIFYNYTVEHGVAPVESGKRYSMAFFFDRVVINIRSLQLQNTNTMTILSLLSTCEGLEMTALIY